MTALSLLLALNFTQSNQDFKPINLVSKIIGVRTGRNGYEEYLLAAETLHTQKFQDAYRAMMKASPGKDDWLSSREALTRESGVARQLINEGNAKTVRDPRIYSLDTLYPDFSYLKMVARYLPVQATVEFSQGQNQRASETLLSGLVFADKLSRTGVLITYLVAQSNVTLTLLGYQDNLERLPLPAWTNVVKHCDFALANTRIGDVVNQELNFTGIVVDTFLTDPAKVTGDFGDSDADADLMERLKRLSAAQKVQIKTAVGERVAAYRRGFAELLKADENKWYEMSAILERAATVEDDPLIDYVLQSSFPIFSNVIIVELKYRAQMRLLRLHAIVQSHRWSTGELPKNLEELGHEKECQDPLSGGRFVYELTPDGYNLYSPGGPGLTRVDLVFRRPASNSQDDEPVPPQ